MMGTGGAEQEREAEESETIDTETDAVDEEETEVVEVDHRPSRLTRAVSLVAVGTGVLLTAPFAFLALPFAVSGLAIVAGGVFVLRSRGWISVGVAFVLSGGIIAGGFQAVPVELMLIAVSATILGWDVGQFGIGVGEQLGRTTPTRQIELAHMAFTLFVLTVVSGLVYLVYQVGGTGRPASAVALSLIGVILLTWVYRR